jgi:Na+-translocating ferredoxin:NAD+ oxidoreductase RNF subunit RnfB
MLAMDPDIAAAMRKIEAMEMVLARLPGLDCGSCGSPSCKSLAEDIVQGLASETDCVFRLRDRVKNLAEEMVDLAQRLPPSLTRRDMADLEEEDETE